MAITIGSGIQIGGGISFDVGTGGGGGGGGGGGNNLGTINVGTFTQDLGMGMGLFVYHGYRQQSSTGSTSGPGGGAARINALFTVNGLGATVTRLALEPGNYGTFTVDSNRLVNGSTANISVTVGGVTVTLQSQQGWNTGSDYNYNIMSDAFSLATKTGQTLNVNVNL